MDKLHHGLGYIDPEAVFTAKILQSRDLCLQSPNTTCNKSKVIGIQSQLDGKMSDKNNPINSITRCGGVR